MGFHNEAIVDPMGSILPTYLNEADAQSGLHKLSKVT